MLWQEIAENFYPERADFTYHRSLGTDFAANLMTSYPVLCRRDLGDQTGMMLRPTAKPWFAAWACPEGEREDNDASAGCSGPPRRCAAPCTTPRRLFTKATKEGDHDWSCFGQCVISVRALEARRPPALPVLAPARRGLG
jgi:hypothetical protein